MSRKISPIISLALFAFLATFATSLGDANTVSSINFAEAISDEPLPIAFPDGTRIAAVYDLGMPLGAEKDVLEAGLKKGN